MKNRKFNPLHKKLTMNKKIILLISMSLLSSMNAIDFKGLFNNFRSQTTAKIAILSSLSFFGFTKSNPQNSDEFLEQVKQNPTLLKDRCVDALYSYARLKGQDVDPSDRSTKFYDATKIFHSCDKNFFHTYANVIREHNFDKEGWIGAFMTHLNISPLKKDQFNTKEDTSSLATVTPSNTYPKATNQLLEEVKKNPTLLQNPCIESLHEYISIKNEQFSDPTNTAYIADFRKSMFGVTVSRLHSCDKSFFRTYANLIKEHGFDKEGWIGTFMKINGI